MKTTKPSISVLLISKLKQASLQWLEGFREACCFHRVIIYCLRSRQLLIRTGQCFLLNGFIFLGSIFVLKSVVIPTLLWILPYQCSENPCSFGSILKFYSLLRFGLVLLFYVFWLYPVYILSFILNNIWWVPLITLISPFLLGNICDVMYIDIAKHGFAAMERNGPDVLKPSSQNEVTASENTALTEKPAGLGGIMIGIGEQVYSLLLLSVFVLEVQATGFVPYIGKALNFVLLSWMYAYYCFDSKWSLYEVPLDKRLDFFESNWAFFAGFGSPCVLGIFFYSPLVSYGIMSILYPLFVLTATGSGADQLIFSQRRNWKGVGLGRLPIFYVADTFSMWVLSFLPLGPREKMQDSKAL